MNLDECFKEGLLRKGISDKLKIDGALQISQDFLDKANKVFEIEQHEIALLMAYNSMFHSARALLFKDGLTERSHFCMFLYLKEKYKENLKISKYLDAANSYREVRHTVQYGGEKCSELDAKESIDDAKNFLAEVKKIVK